MTKGGHFAALEQPDALAQGDQHNVQRNSMNAPVTQLEIDQRIYDLYDEYCHGAHRPARVPARARPL